PETAAALDTFDTEDANGDWTLGICDDAGIDIGTVNRVLLSFNTPGINPLPAADSNAAPQVCSASGADDSSPTSGTVNSYFPAAGSVSAGATSIDLDAATGSGSGISQGDLLMVIQVQDALIDSSNNLYYGDGSGAGASGSTDIRQTGLYEFATASNTVGTGGGTLTLTSGLSHAYNHDTNRRFQVIRVPRYNDLTLSGTLTAAAWNGNTGGIIVIDVLGTLDFNGNNIDVSGQGFRPGAFNGGNSTSTNLVEPNWVVSNTSNNPSFTHFGSKGEGIAGTPSIGSFGGGGYPAGDLTRGAPGNAGGGANNHNGGGGGGSNIGFGGRGGFAWSSGDAGGRGGASFNGYSGRLLLGGGGGAGNANNSSIGGGGNGGGLAFVNATSVTGSGSILASGVTAPNSQAGGAAGNDGAGGGGAGGTIVIRTASTSVTGLTLDVSGGDGGDVITTNPHGPGGGGGGGAIYIDATGA
ncbi:MAG: hypothetical protein GY694_05485, partial [Gammaproteobacteria bacterium]|nr:hypothetical protein [Gammaproteobacteria bacterium]